MMLRLRVKPNHLKQPAIFAAVVLLLISFVLLFTGCLRQGGSTGPADKTEIPGVGAASQTSRPETAGPLMPDLPDIDPGGFELPYEEPAEPVSGGLSDITPDVSPVTVSP